jgi:hypothetical protein
LPSASHLCPARRPGQGGTPPLPLAVRLDALGAVVLDGLSYRRAARMVGICKTEVGEAAGVDGLATRVQRPGGWANQKVLYDAKRRTHTARAWRCPSFQRKEFAHLPELALIRRRVRLSA